MRKVLVKHTIIIEHEFEDGMTNDQIDFLFNESSWCANNLLTEMEKLDAIHQCVCHRHKAEVVPDIDGQVINERKLLK